MDDILFEKTTVARSEKAGEQPYQSVVPLARWQRVLLSLSVLGAILWLGGAVVRTSIAYDLFVPGTLEFKASLPTDAVAQTLRLYSRTAFYTSYGYGIALLGFLPVFLSMRKRWRSYGWLLIAGVLFLLYTPLEGIFLYYDWLLTRVIPNADTLPVFDIEQAKAVVLESLRLPFLGDVGQGARLLALLGYISAIVIVVWRPLHKNIHNTPTR